MIVVSLDKVNNCTKYLLEISVLKILYILVIISLNIFYKLITFFILYVTINKVIKRR